MTETTTQPDPQVEWGPSCPVCGNLPDQPDAHWPGCGKAHVQRRLLWPRPARKPLTLADIPAGQGAASLYLTRSDGELDLYYRQGDGIGDRILILAPHPALREHLAATLPTIDTTEEA